MRPRLALACVLFTMGCGARSGLAGLAVDDASVDVPIVTDTAPVVDTASPCAPLDAALQAKMGHSHGSCTIVVRVAEPSLTVTGYHFFCGEYGIFDEVEALEQSVRETGVSPAGCYGEPSLSGSSPKDVFLFWNPASAAACACCGDGSFTAVSVRNGLTLLGGLIRLGGDGTGLLFPAAFDPPSELGAGCASKLGFPSVRGFDLSVMAAPGARPPALDASTMDAALKVLWDTALPEAITGRAAYFADAMVLRYAPIVGPGAKSELLVLLDTSYLE